MPLLMCPNDSSPMQTLDRSGVQFDMCPSCRGVWLDRGELEKLMETSASEGRASAPTPTAPPPPQAAPWSQTQSDPYRRDRDRDYDDRYRHDDRDRYRKKKRDSIFDIFD